jgi:hypothetical protein
MQTTNHDDIFGPMLLAAQRTRMHQPELLFKSRGSSRSGAHGQQQLLEIGEQGLTMSTAIADASVNNCSLAVLELPICCRGMLA